MWTAVSSTGSRARRRKAEARTFFSRASTPLDSLDATRLARALTHRRASHMGRSRPNSLDIQNAAKKDTESDQKEVVEHTTFDQEFCNRIQPKLEALEQIRGDLNKENVSVPCIAVVGEQSAGKSSVMEYIADIKFPRAENTCTRCPTIASLVCDASIEAPYATIGLDPDKKTHERVDDLEGIAAKIEELTDELTAKIGNGVGLITKEPIYVRVVRPSGPTLTLIDLPGITHMCTDGEQDNIHEVTTGLIDTYISDENAVVLVVIPATADFGNAEALKMAKKYDPDGSRTLGVVTKCDLSKPDDNLVEKVKMEGKHIQLEMGFVALRCRTPSEVKSNLSRAEAMAKEKALFSTSPHLSRLDAAQWGLSTLISKVVSVQAERVDSFIPEFKTLLASKLREVEMEFQKLPPLCTTDAARTILLDSMLRQVNNTLHGILSGSMHLKDKKMHLPSMWDKKCNEFEAALRKATPDFFSDKYKTQLKNNMDEVQGAALPNFMSTPVFRKALQTIYFEQSSASNPIGGILVSTTNTVVDQVRDATTDAIELIMDEHVADAPKLNAFLKERLCEFMTSKSIFVVNHIRVMLEAELVKPHTHNHYYSDTIAKVREQIQKRAAGMDIIESTPSSSLIEDIEEYFLDTAAREFKNGQSNFDQSIRDMQVSLFSYCKAMRKCIVDVVAKLVWSEMMHGVDMELTKVLKHSVSDSELLEKLMAEDRSTAHKREKIKLTVERFSKSLEVLRSVV